MDGLGVDRPVHNRPSGSSTGHEIPQRRAAQGARPEMQGNNIGYRRWLWRDLTGDICARCFEKGLTIETSGGRAHGEVVKVLAPLSTPRMRPLREALAILLDARGGEGDKHHGMAAE